MQTSFSDSQRADPLLAEAEGILRKCVHCGILHRHLSDLRGAVATSWTARAGAST